MSLRHRFRLPFKASPSGSGRERKQFFLTRQRERRGRDSSALLRRLDLMVRVGIGLMLVVAASLLFPTRQVFKYSMNEGAITSEAIVSPVTFSIYKSEEELARQREEARMSVPPVLQLRPDVRTRQLARLDSLFLRLGSLRDADLDPPEVVSAFQQIAPEVSAEAIRYLLALEAVGVSEAERLALSMRRMANLRDALSETLSGYYALGVVESLPAVREVARTTVTIDTGEIERTQQVDSLIDLALARDDLPQHLRQRMPGGDDRLIKGGYEAARILLVPNLVVQLERTERRRQEAANRVALTKGTILRGEEIIGANKRVTAEDVEKIRSLERVLAESEFERGGWYVARNWLARLLVVALILGIYAAFLTYHRPSMLAETRIVVTLVLVLAAELVLAFLLRESGVFSTYLVPVAVATMLLTILFDTGVGLVTSFSLGLLLGSVMGLDYPITLIHTAAGAAGVYAVRRVRRRSHFYRALWLVPVIYAVGIAAVEGLRLTEFSEMSALMGYGVANGLLSVVVTIGLLPLFESIFRFSTDITLLELSDLNHPLLRQMAIRAPGTYHHSLMMGELGAAAAETCGANPLLTRVGAYFHDIGKMNKPEYFVENQSGRNPHTTLRPHMSALILASHVKEGLDMAEQHRLPEKIRCFIPEHHGTMTISFFYMKALEEAEEGTRVSDDDFRYPGPRPQSMETGIIMLADAVEAASRVLQDPSPSRIRGLVDELVRHRFEEGQLDECPLTMRDLKAIREAFTAILISRFHHRIEYPDREETIKKVADRDTRGRRRSRAGAGEGSGSEQEEGAEPPAEDEAPGFDSTLPAGSGRPPAPEEDA